MTCHLCAKQNCIGECEPKVTPMAWKHYTRALERRLEHLETKAHKNSFDKHEASALRHVLGIVKQSQRQWVGLTDEEIDQGLLRSDYALKTAHAWRDGVVFAMTKLKEKNT